MRLTFFQLKGPLSPLISENFSGKRRTQPFSASLLLFFCCYDVHTLCLRYLLYFWSAAIWRLVIHVILRYSASAPTTGGSV